MNLVLTVKLTCGYFFKGKVTKDGIIIDMLSLDARGNHCVAELNPTSLNQHLGMAGVGFIHDTSGIEANHAIEHPDLFITVRRLTQMALQLQVEDFFQFGFVPEKVLASSETGEIITMDDD